MYLGMRTSLPWGSIWSTQCHPMRSRGPWPGNIQHKPSHIPHSDVKASGRHQWLNPSTVVAVQAEEGNISVSQQIQGTWILNWHFISQELCYDF